MCFACGVLPQLWWSQNQHSLTVWVLLSADDMSVMDCQRSKQKLFLPIHISDHVLFKWFTYLWANTCSCFPVHSWVQLGLCVFCRRGIVSIWKSRNLMRTAKWPPWVLGTGYNFCLDSTETKHRNMQKHKLTFTAHCTVARLGGYIKSSKNILHTLHRKKHA